MKEIFILFRKGTRVVRDLSGDYQIAEVPVVEEIGRGYATSDEIDRAIEDDLDEITEGIRNGWDDPPPPFRFAVRYPEYTAAREKAKAEHYFAVKAWVPEG